MSVMHHDESAGKRSVEASRAPFSWIDVWPSHDRSVDDSPGPPAA